MEEKKENKRLILPNWIFIAIILVVILIIMIIAGIIIYYFMGSIIQKGNVSSELSSSEIGRGIEIIRRL
jgi:flagellar basal body-associated protein FliL